MLAEIVMPLAVLALVGAIMLYPNQYRRFMARLCSADEERIPPYPRSAAVAMIVFFGLIMLAALIRRYHWR